MCFPAKCTKFLRTRFLQNTSGDCFSIKLKRKGNFLNVITDFLKNRNQNTIFYKKLG